MKTIIFWLILACVWLASAVIAAISGEKTEGLLCIIACLICCMGGTILAAIQENNP